MSASVAVAVVAGGGGEAPYAMSLQAAAISNAAEANTRGTMRMPYQNTDCGGCQEPFESGFLCSSASVVRAGVPGCHEVLAQPATMSAAKRGAESLVGWALAHRIRSTEKSAVGQGPPYMDTCRGVAGIHRSVTNGRRDASGNPYNLAIQPRGIHTK